MVIGAPAAGNSEENFARMSRDVKTVISSIVKLYENVEAKSKRNAPVGEDSVSSAVRIRDKIKEIVNDIENILKLNRNVEIYLRGRIINGESVKLLQEAKPILDGIYWDISQFVQIVTQLTIGAKGNVFKGAPPDKFPAINLLKQLRIDIKVIGKAANNIEIARKLNMKASDMI